MAEIKRDNVPLIVTEKNNVPKKRPENNTVNTPGPQGSVPRTRGRPKKWASEAERKAAYRERRK
jgi:hypothetical protein